MANCDIRKEISISFPLYKSELGKYFIGQTPLLVNESNKGLAALVNPITSKIDIYINAITITNTDSTHISSEIYLTPGAVIGGKVSSLYNCSNTAIKPSPKPHGEVQYFTSISGPPSGVSIFTRLVQPMSTEVIDGSQIILAPGKSLFVYLGGYDSFTTGKYIVAFGWWENKVC